MNSEWVQTAGGILIPAQAGLWTPPVIKRKRYRPTHVDLFCGAGGMGCGFASAGFDTVAAADFDVHCAITYMTNLGAYPCEFHFLEPEGKARFENALRKIYGLDKKSKPEFALRDDNRLPFPTSGSGRIHRERQKAEQPDEIIGCEHFFLGDVRNLTGAMILKAVGMDVGEVDCVSGGPPCQGFSHAGKREVMDPRNSLVFEFARLVIEIRPKTFVFENVPGIINMVTTEGLPVIDAFCQMLEDGGYGRYQALKRSLESMPNARAAMPDPIEVEKTKETKRSRNKRGNTSLAAQGSLF